MAAVIFIVNQRGDEVISRHFRLFYFYSLFAVAVTVTNSISYYRGDVSKSSMDSFRNKVSHAFHLI